MESALASLNGIEAAASEPRVIRAGTLIDGTGAPPVRDGVVIIEDQKIRYAGPAAGAPAVDVPAEQRLDAPDGTVLPGLIDSHVHLTFNARTEATSPAVIEQIVTDDDWMIAIRAVQAAQAALAAGVTTVRDCGAKGLVTLRLRDLIAEGFINGPRIVACGMPITTTAGHCHWLGLQADTEDEVIRATREMVREGADFIKVMATGGGMTRDSNVNEPQYTLAQLTAIRQEAHRLGRRVTAHSHAGTGQRVCLDAKFDMIEHCNWHTPEGWSFDEELMGEVVRAGMYIGITLSGPQQSAAKAEQSPDELSDALQDRYDTLREMRQMGAKIVLHSDAIAPITTYEDYPFSLVAAVRYGGFTPIEAVHAATGLAAEAIGLGETTGTLAPGKAADVLVVDGDVGGEIRAVSETRWVIRNGRVVAGNGVVRVTPSCVPAGIA
jgi:imidazolonepropionase-like amidohydrolase